MTATKKPLAFAPRHHDERAAAASITRDGRMRRIRRFAFSIIVAAIATIAIGIVAFDEGEEITVQVEQTTIGEAGEIRVEGITLRGGTDDGKTFSIRAESAAENTNAPNLVNLTGIEATITSADGDAISMTAARGAYRRDEHTIRLEGGITVSRPAAGLELQTDAAFVDLGKGLIKSDTGVEGTGPQGKVRADGFEITDDGGDIKLFGNARVVIE